MNKATLLVIQGVDQGTRFEIGEEPADIGRGVRNAVRILDTEVSRKHATIECSDGVFCLTDRGSSNGTFVNGQPVRRRVLSGGDHVQIGRSILLFQRAAADDSQSIVDKVDFRGEKNPDDRSRIVGTVNQDVGQELLDRQEAAPTDELAQTLANLQVLYRISEEAVTASISIDQLLQRILDLTIDVVGADRGCLLLADAESAEIIPRFFSHRRGADVVSKMTISRSIVDYVLHNGQGVCTSDAQSDQRFSSGQSILQAGIREAMCVPMQGRFELRGVVYVDTTTPPERVILDGGQVRHFSDDQLRLLVAIGRQAAVAIEDNRYQQALIKAERLAAIGQTIAMLSHHIKNILQGIRGGSYLIDMGLKDDKLEFIRKGWGIVERNQNKIYHLVMDMLTFSTERKPALEEAAINETVTEVCELLTQRSEEAGVRLELQLDETLPLAYFDAEGIQRALLNITINALDAVESVDEGTVLVQTGHDEKTDAVFIAVTDNGPGIPSGQVDRVFNVFESTKGARGTGLGLAVSRKIIREHGGEITVETRPNEGCRFTLSWPRVEEDQPPAQTSAGL